MNYPPANVWTKLEPEIEQRIEPEPALLEASAGLYLPAAWSDERRDEFTRALGHKLPESPAFGSQAA